MHVVIAGAGGFLGSALVDHLRTAGHQVTRLVRSGTPGSDASLWDPATGRIDRIVIDRADAVVNLSGASIARWPRTKRYKPELVSSRIDSTSTLVRAIVASETPTALISSSAMGIYGTDRGDEVLTESSPQGPGFLADLCRDWEAAAAPAAEAGQRVCLLRTGLPLHREGGMLGPLLPLFKTGGGARLGDGTQYMSLMSRHDWCRAVTFLLEHESASGPFNLSMPAAVTNAEFTDRLGEALSRPTFLVAPKPVLKVGLGALADDLLGSVRMAPEGLQAAGFGFEHTDLPEVLRSALA